MTLLAFERRWLLAVFDTVLPRTGDGDGLSPSAAEAPVDRFLDDLIDHAPTHFLLGLRVCVWVVMFAPLFVLGRFRTFVGLEAESRLLLLHRLGASENYVIREIPLLFKTIACLGICGLPDVQTKIGIRPTDSLPPEWARRGLPQVLR